MLDEIDEVLYHYPFAAVGVNLHTFCQTFRLASPAVFEPNTQKHELLAGALGRYKGHHVQLNGDLKDWVLSVAGGRLFYLGPRLNRWEVIGD